MRKIFLLIIILLMVFMGNAFSSEIFNKRIETIRVKVIDLTHEGALFRVPEFVEIWESPKTFKEDVLSLLADPSVPLINKEISGLSLHRLPINELVDYCESVISLKIAGKINEELMGYITIPPIQWTYLIQENYKNKNVRKMLLRMQKNIKNKNLITYIDKILSGKAIKRIKSDKKEGLY